LNLQLRGRKLSELLHFSEHRLQEMALTFMGLVYVTRIIWFLSFKSGRERQMPTGAPDTTPSKGVIYSWAAIAMPWAMESLRRRRFLLYVQFVIFHLGVATAITLSFIIPYGAGLLELRPLVIVVQVVTGAACLMGIMRFIRRVGSRYMRAISAPDDYFSLALLTFWLFFATLAAPNSIEHGEGHLIVYFILTAFFLVYVPFSKISHYLYYPFVRYYLGKSLGYRGVYPIRHGQRGGKA
jgi:nitrate reductase gamma subunit